MAQLYSRQMREIIRAGRHAHREHLLRVSVFAATTTTTPVMSPPGSTPPHVEASLDSKEFNPKSKTIAKSSIQGQKWEV
jgi:hypothetical protein